MNKLTVAICTYRRYELLHKCLDSLKKQTIKLSDFKIIIVDNSLQPELGTDFRDKFCDFPNIEYFITQKAGIAFARTFAIEHTFTQFLAFIDDDSIATINWVENMISAIERYSINVGAIGGKVLPIWAVEKPLWLDYSMLGALAVVDWGDAECEIDERQGKWLVSTNIAYNVDAVKKLNGFRKELGRNQGTMICHEELDLHNRLTKAGYKIMYCPELVVHHKIHENRVNKEFLCDLMFSEGYSRSLMEELEGDSFKQVFSIFNNVLPPNKAAGCNLFTDTNDPVEFKKKLIAISNLGRLLYHSRRVIENAPESCFEIGVTTRIIAPLVVEENSSCQNISLSGELIINNIMSPVIKRECEFTNRIWMVIPCLNAENTIDETLDSIFTQKGEFTLFLHVQDGGSTDSTMEIVKHWCEKSSHSINPQVIMTYRSELDLGMYDAINKGFSILNVPDDGFMTWLNSDDLLRPNAFQTIIEVSRKMNFVHWVCGNRSSMKENGEIIWESKVLECSRFSIMHGICDNIHNPFVQQEGTFWRGWLWRHVGGVNENLKLAGDYDLWIRFAKVAELFSVNKVLATFRYRNGSLSSNLDNYFEEVNNVMQIDSRDEGDKKLVQLLFDGYVMLMPVIIFDEENKNVSISWRNSIEIIPKLKDKIRAFYYDNEEGESLSTNALRTQTMLYPRNRERSVEKLKSKKLPLVSDSRWLGEKIWIYILLRYWNRKQIRLIRRSNTFNSKWYLNYYTDVKKSGIDPIVHYVFHGAIEGRKPNSWFDTTFYLDQYPDVVESRLNPFFHYLTIGLTENRNRNAVELYQKSSGKSVVLLPSNNQNSINSNSSNSLFMGKLMKLYRCIFTYKKLYFSGLFMSLYYIDQYPDIATSKVNPLWHYISHGESEGRMPNPMFDPDYYRSSNRDLTMNKNLNMLLHYYLFGAKEGRSPNGDDSANKYLKNNPDVASKGLNPIAHYLRHGIREGRNW